MMVTYNLILYMYTHEYMILCVIICIVHNPYTEQQHDVTTWGDYSGITWNHTPTFQVGKLINVAPGMEQKKTECMDDEGSKPFNIA